MLKVIITISILLLAIVLILTGVYYWADFSAIQLNSLKPLENTSTSTNSIDNNVTSTDNTSDNSVSDNEQPQENQWINDKSDLIKVTAPTAYEKVTSPLTITGEARGTWYFEASFPIFILDANGKVLGQAIAQAQGEWMTESFVPFTATLNFASSTTAIGALALEKDNPSGLPENADELLIPVKF